MNFIFLSIKFILLYLLAMVVILAPPANARSNFSQVEYHNDVLFFEKKVNELTQASRWVGSVTTYSKGRSPVSFGKYVYDNGTLRRVFKLRGSAASFIMITDGKVSCERPSSEKFPDSLEADLKAEWTCVRSGNAELVRFVYSLRPQGVMRILNSASKGKTEFILSRTSSNNKELLIVNIPKASNIKKTKLEFSLEGATFSANFYSGTKLTSESYLTPAGDSDFVTQVSDLKKKWKK